MGKKDLITFVNQNVDNKHLKSIIENKNVIVKFGLIFFNQINVIENLPTRINQDIKFVDIQTWKVYEHYKVNGIGIKNELGYFDSSFKYVPTIKVIQEMIFTSCTIQIFAMRKLFARFENTTFESNVSYDCP